MRKTQWQKHIIGVYHWAYPYLGWCDGDPQMIDYSKGFCLGLPPLYISLHVLQKETKCRYINTVQNPPWMVWDELTGFGQAPGMESFLPPLPASPEVPVSSARRGVASLWSWRDWAAFAYLRRWKNRFRLSLQHQCRWVMWVQTLGLNKCLSPKWVRLLQGLRTFFFHLRKRWVNGGHVSQWHSAGDGVSTYGIVFDASMGPENQGSRVLVHSQLLDARCSKCSKLVLDVPRHRWYWTCWRSWPMPMDHRSSGVNHPRHLRLRPSAFQRRSCGPRRITAWQNMCCVNNKLTWCCTA